MHSSAKHSNKEIAGSAECSPKAYLLSIKGTSCNQTLLVHQYMTKKTNFYEKNKEDIYDIYMF